MAGGNNFTGGGGFGGAAHQRGETLLKIDHFFQGKLSKEEVASAFLAMILEGVPAFRRYFFKLIAPEEFSSLARKKWAVQVEVRHVDIRMQAGGTIVLMENKINAGAKQKSQLLRYYKQERRHDPEARLILVFLAPGSIGKGEIAQILETPEFKSRPSDLACHLSWEALAKYRKNEGEVIDEIIGHGLKEIARVIAEARLEKYACIGDRKIIRDIVKRAMDSIGEKNGIALRHWAGRENEQIYTNNTNVTLWLDTRFKARKEPPYEPINLYNEQGLIQVTIRSQFKLEGKVKPNSELGKWWRQYLAAGFIDIPGVGRHQRQENNWFVYSQPASGNREAIEATIFRTGAKVLETLKARLSSAGFNLSKV